MMLTHLQIEQLAEGMVLEQDIFGPESNRAPLLTKDTILTRRQIDMLKHQGVLDAYVRGRNTQELIKLPLPRSVLQPQLRDEALQNLTDLFRFFRQGEQDKQRVLGLLKQTDTLVDQLLICLQMDNNARVHIADLKSYNEYTYHHSLSVAVLAIAIGQALELNERQLHDLGISAMMHDIGKTAIPLDIINKPSYLNAEEYSILKRHSPQGYQFLNKYTVNNPVLLAAVLFHHERYDGSGYPYGLKGDKIPLFSRIITVADVYDALTSYRPYRRPESPGEAVEYIMGNAGMAFDYDIICAMLDKLELYPVGSVVRLSNGQRAVVADNDNTLRPRLIVLETGATLDLNRDLDCLNITIKNILPFEV
jgi:HD-GYP domain-containing protein (c-di-GMP phosphodiesterase class II)